MKNDHKNNQVIEDDLFSFTALEQAGRDYYRKYGQLHAMDGFLEVVKQVEKQGNYLFNSGSSALEIENGKIQISEGLFRDAEDVAIDKHPRYNPDFIHQHQFFEITYVLRGHCKQIIYASRTPEELNCVAGDLLILPPGIDHSILVDDDESIVLNILVRESSFKKVFLHSIPDTTILADFFTSILYSQNQANYILFNTEDNQQIRNLICDIYKEYKKAERYYPVLLNLLLAQLFMYVLRNHGDSVKFPQDYPREIDYIPMIMQYMEINYSWLTVKDIANHFGFSLSHLGRLYKAYTTVTISESLRTIRMKKSAEFLLGTFKSVEEITRMVGYQDTTNFIRQFKRHYSQTPKQYRIANQNLK